MSDRLTITDAAGLLGVHRNTVRNRIRRGVYPSARLDDDGRAGQVWTLDRADLDLPDAEAPALPSRETRKTPVLPRVETDKTPALPTPETPETAGDVVTRALAPLMAELVTLTDRLAQTQQERADAEVARRIAEHERDRLRAELDRLKSQPSEEPKPTRRWDLPRWLRPRGDR